jgi:hypothetical protein
MKNLTSKEIKYLQKAQGYYYEAKIKNTNETIFSLTEQGIINLLNEYCKKHKKTFNDINYKIKKVYIKDNKK